MPVVNATTTHCEVFIGRAAGHRHFGNPWSYKIGTNGLIKVETPEEAAACFEMWLTGEAFEEVEPKRRQWILDNLRTLKGKVLGDYCLKHAEVLERLSGLC